MNGNAVFRLIHEGFDVWSIPAEMTPEIERFNEMCMKFDQTKWMISPPVVPEGTPEEEHDRHAANWLVPDDIKQIDVRTFLLSICTDAARDRVNQEMDLYEERDLIPLLQLMMYLVNYFRENDVVWGVGRGSSVASYVLFLIGVHKIDPLKYGLSIDQFLK